MARRSAPYKPEWVPLDGMAEAFALVGSKGAVCWRGRKGWWAQRPGSEIAHGPFSRNHQARKWAEEPARLAFEKEREDAANKAADKKAKAEVAQKKIWGDLSPEERKLRPGQIWAMKAAGHQDHQVLIVDLRKQSVLALVRANKRPWGVCSQDVRSNHALLHLYRYVGEAKIPKAKAK